MATRQGYNAIKVAGQKEKCSNCELLNILGKPKYGQKRCKDCIEKENKRKMKQKHIPVHLRKRNLSEQTEKASRILAEEIGAAEGEEDLLGHRNVDEGEHVELSDILEITFELLDLVEAYVSRSGNLEEIARFESQLKLLRKGRDTVISNGHLEDKRAILLAFSIFTEHYTLLTRDHEKVLKKNQALKQLAYDTAGLVKKNEAQFESYVKELKSLQGQNFNVHQSTKIEMTKLKNEITALKLELNLRTNELRETQLELNATKEQAARERDRMEEMRRDKDSRITNLLAQLQQFSLDYAHEKSERLRLEKENERLWSDRMAYRADQIRNRGLSAAERAAAVERDAIEKREWMEWKKKSALREIASKERLRNDAWEVRRSIEADAANTVEQIRRELGAAGLSSNERHTDDGRPSTIFGKSKEQRAAEREALRKAASEDDTRREFWMESEQKQVEKGSMREVADSIRFPPDLSPISNPTAAGINAQRWGSRMARQNEEEEIDRMIEELRLKNEATKVRTNTNPALNWREGAPPSDVIRAGNYSGGVESVLNNPRHSPALPYFSDTPANALTWQNPPQLQPNRLVNNYTSTDRHPSAVSYQPTSVASSIPPPHAGSTAASASTEAHIQELQRQVEELKAANQRKSEVLAESVHKPASIRSSTTITSSSSTLTSASHHAPASSASSATDYLSIEEELRRSRKIRGENSRLNTHALPLTAEAVPESKHSARSTTSSSSSRRSEQQRERERESSHHHRRGGSVTVEDEVEEEEQQQQQPRSKRSSASGGSSSRSRGRVERERSRSRSRSASSLHTTSDEEIEKKHSRRHSSKSSKSSKSSAAPSSRRYVDSDGEEDTSVQEHEAVPVRNLTLYSVKK